MKTTDHRLQRVSAIILFSVFALISCTKVTTPEPSENPVLFTHEEQNRSITVENMFYIAPFDSTDKTIDENGYRSIENEWISVTQFYPDNDNFDDPIRKILKIEVKENTTGEARTHAVTIGSGTKSTVLTVIQAGKSNQ